MAIYFVQAGETGAIKLGHSQNATRRASSLGGWSPVPLRTLAIIEDADSASEAWLHMLMSEHRAHKEWFNPTPFVWGVINTLKATGTYPGMPRRAIWRVGFERINLIRDVRKTVFKRTIAEMAALCGVSRSTITGWESFSTPSCIAMARVLFIAQREGIELSMSDLYRDEPIAERGQGRAA